jgi:hypothetical protein
MAKSAVCKFVCEWHKEYGPHGPTSYRLVARYDPDLPEDRRFNEATPWGEMEIGIQNPALAGFFSPGKAYYITITPAEEAK